MSTPTVTRAIDRLEDILGFPLFKREADGAKLTEEGRRLAKTIEDAEKSVFDVWELASPSYS